MEATWDKNGDIDRESFLGEVVGGKQKIVEDLAEAQQVKASSLKSSARRQRRAEAYIGGRQWRPSSSFWSPASRPGRSTP